MWLQSVVGSTTVEAGASVASTFDEKERMVVAIINRICIFAITYFTDKSEFIYEKGLSFGYINITCFMHQDA